MEKINKEIILHDATSTALGSTGLPIPTATIAHLAKRWLPGWLVDSRYYLKQDDDAYLANIYRRDWARTVCFNRFGINESVSHVFEIDNTRGLRSMREFVFRLKEKTFTPDKEILGHTEESYRRFRLFLKIRGQRYFDGTLLRLLDVHLRANCVDMTCEATKYATVCRTSLMLDARDTATARSLREIVHADGSVGSLRDSRLANAIGVDCLLFTSDHRLVMPMRSARVVVNPHKLSSSFSGDMEYTDVNGPKTTMESIHVLREGMEELHLQPGDVDRESITFLALTRDLLRGGKPQMFFAARTKLTKEELLERHPDAIDAWEFKGRSRRRRWVFWSFSDDLLRTEPKSAEQCSRIAERAREMLRALGRDMSMPLRANVLLWLQRELGPAPEDDAAAYYSDAT